MKRKRVVVLGATGSIGESALKVARDIPERMEIVGLAANSNAKKLATGANKFRPKSVCLVDQTKIDILRDVLEYEPRIFAGEEGLCEIACLTNADMALVAIVGTGGLRPALAAIEAQGLANIRLHFGDAIMLIDWLPAASLAGIDLIYPDPWPKRRHWKRRFVQDHTIADFARLLRPGAEFRFATDVPDYAAWTLARFARARDFVWTAERARDWQQP